jgi:glycosyltransferase involved in cell wall biosynthesis
MKNNDVAFLTTVYPAAEGFLDEFFNSLQKQTEKHFDVIIINDGIKNLQSYKSRYNELNIIEKKVSSLPAKNREIGIKAVINLGYEYIIFGDSDDYFSENRIEKTIMALNANHLVINELTLFSKYSEQKDFLKNNLKNMDSPQENILNGNVFGFSNIGIRSEVINPQFNLTSDLIIIDWFFVASILLKKDCQIQFLNDVYTYYRQHSSNTIGMSKVLTKNKLEFSLLVKQKHYDELLKFCKINHLDKDFRTFEVKLKEMKALKKKLSNSIFREKYIALVNANIDEIFSGWWSEIISLEEVDYYEDKN